MSMAKQNAVFRTVLPPNPTYRPINLSDPILLAGSCFAEEIGGRLKKYKFFTENNPFGTLFNPLSLFGLLRASLSGEALSPSRYVQREGGWTHFDVHSQLHAPTQPALAALIGGQMATTAKHLQQPGFLFLTLGTAWVYRLRADGQTVANCHKVAASAFEKILLTPEQIVDAFGPLYTVLPAQMQIVLTVSPVRHLKDTLPLNAVSKSVLRLACHYLAEKYPNVQYYPAYELLTDDLRDYRFYQPDMIHPSGVAVDYIWEHFSGTFLSDSARAFVAKWQNISNMLQHRPLQPGTEAHRVFLEKLLATLKAITEVPVSAEIQEVREQLAKFFPPPTQSPA